MASGLGASLVLIAIGAILDFAVTVNGNEHGFNINKVGMILLIVGIVGAVISLAAMAFYGRSTSGFRRHQTLVEDGQGNMVRREDTYQ